MVNASPSAMQLAADVAAGRRSAQDLCREALAQIERENDELNAFVEVWQEAALARAREVDAAVDEGKPVGPLAGVPIAIKDNLCTRTGHTTCGSEMLRAYRSPYDAAVVERVLAAGAVIVGKTNLDEFAMGSSSEHSCFGPTRNPWNRDHVAGGSSGGSAAAVAARMTRLALGSDTGGSIRQPAAYCGVVGLKPTYGRVSRYGLVAFGSSLDQVGPLAASVPEAALLLDVVAGHDARDSTAVREAAGGYVEALQDEALEARRGSLRIGLVRGDYRAAADEETEAALEAVRETYEALGADFVEIDLPNAVYGIAAYYLIATAEASSNLARFDGVHYGRRPVDVDGIVDLYNRSRSEGFGDEVKRRVMLGTFALSAGYHDKYYEKALRVRRLIRQEYEQAFAECDVVLGPVTPSAAFPLGEKRDDPLAMYKEDLFTVPVNLAGLPAISVPAGRTRSGLPIGVQLVGPAFAEQRLLQAARLFERETHWHMALPGAGDAGEERA